MVINIKVRLYFHEWSQVLLYTLNFHSLNLLGQVNVDTNIDVRLIYFRQAKFTTIVLISEFGTDA